MPRPTKGQRTPGSGRKKGVTNGDTAKLRELILGALDDVGGREYLAKQAIKNPTAFMSLIGRVLPKDVKIAGDSENPVKINIAPALTPEQWANAFSIKNKTGE